MQSWKAIFFVIILALSILTSNLAPAQANVINSTKSEPTQSELTSDQMLKQLEIIKSKHATPKQQMSMGLPIDEIVCFNNMILVKKLSTNSPACVKPQTAQKLVERGWGEMVSMNKTNPESTCKANGGQWDEKYRECVGVSSQACKALNGTYDECASACRHITPANGEKQVCIAVCVQVCSVK